jgi:hypothetical protein
MPLYYPRPTGVCRAGLPERLVRRALYYEAGILNNLYFYFIALILSPSKYSLPGGHARKTGQAGIVLRGQIVHHFPK